MAAGQLSSGRWQRTASVAAGLTLLLGCGADPAVVGPAPTGSVSPAAAQEPALRLDPAPGLGVGAPVSAADITLGNGHGAFVSVVTELGGVITTAVGPAGTPVFRFPKYDSREVAPGAVVTVDPAGRPVLDPGAGDFGFGADLALDETTSGTTQRDDGDNVLQRGLFDQGAQFKLQVDKHVPSCSFEGTSGRVDVRADGALKPRAWYRVECSRSGDDFTLTVGRVEDDGGVTPVEEVTSKGDVGTLEFGAGTLLNLGGKIAPDGGLASATDQFNGLVGNVYVSIP